MYLQNARAKARTWVRETRAPCSCNTLCRLSSVLRNVLDLGSILIKMEIVEKGKEAQKIFGGGKGKKRKTIDLRSV